VTGSRGGAVVVWDAATGKAQHTFYANAKQYLTDHPLDVTSVNFSPDGSQVAMVATDLFVKCQGMEVKVWKVATGEVTFTLSLPPYLFALGIRLTLGHVAFSPDGSLLAVGYSSDVKIWDFANKRKLLTLTGHNRVIADLVFSPDGKRLATVSDDGTAKMWYVSLALSLGVTTLHEQFTVPGRYSVAFSPDGKRLATASDDGTTNVWSAATGALLFTLPGHIGSVRGVEFSPNGTQIVTVSTDKTVRLWEPSPGKELFTLNLILRPRLLRIAQMENGSSLSTKEGTVAIWDAITGQQLSSFSTPDISTAIMYSPDGSRIATGGGSGRVWDAATGKEIYKLPDRAGFDDGLTFSPDGTLLVTAGVDRK